MVDEEWDRPDRLETLTPTDMNETNKESSDSPTPPSGGKEASNPSFKGNGGVLASVWGALCATWMILLFIVTLLIFMIPFLLFCYFLPDPKKTRRFVRFSRVWMGVFLPLSGCPLRVKGREKFQKGETYIVLCNHNALMDVPLTTPGIPGGNKTIAKIEMAKIPLFGMIYRTGSVLVDRKSETSRRDSFNKMREALEMGLHMCLYPEGTRNKTSEPLKSFHDGAFRLSLATGKAMIPGIIF